VETHLLSLGEDVELLGEDSVERVAPDGVALRIHTDKLRIRGLDATNYFNLDLLRTTYESVVRKRTVRDKSNIVVDASHFVARV
jgi:hypothetical protein